MWLLQLYPTLIFFFQNLFYFPALQKLFSFDLKVFSNVLQRFHLGILFVSSTGKRKKSEDKKRETKGEFSPHVLYCSVDLV